jgi:protein gp37
MGIKTGIHWVDSTVNPTMGCDGCELWSLVCKICYAGILHLRWGGKTPGFSPTFEQVTLWPGRMAKAAAWSDLRGKPRPGKSWLDRLPRLIFVSDMSDALSASVTFTFLFDEIIRIVTSEKGLRHQWLWLTKRPARMAEFFRWLRDEHGQTWPSNLWAGTSVTTQATTTRVRELLRVGDQDTIHFVSAEPQIEPIDLSEYLPRIKWVIGGGESGAKARAFDMEWARAMLLQCREHGVPYFLKQLGSVVLDGGERVYFDEFHADEWSKWPIDLRVREFPIAPPVDTAVARPSTETTARPTNDIGPPAAAGAVAKPKKPSGRSRTKSKSRPASKLSPRPKT